MVCIWGEQKLFLEAILGMKYPGDLTLIDLELNFHIVERFTKIYAKNGGVKFVINLRRETKIGTLTEYIDIGDLLAYCCFNSLHHNE